jgi:hypothetical protein
VGKGHSLGNTNFSLEIFFLGIGKTGAIDRIDRTHKHHMVFGGKGAFTILVRSFLWKKHREDSGAPWR